MRMNISTIFCESLTIYEFVYLYHWFYVCANKQTIRISISWVLSLWWSMDCMHTFIYIFKIYEENNNAMIYGMSHPINVFIIESSIAGWWWCHYSIAILDITYYTYTAKPLPNEVNQSTFRTLNLKL